MTLDTRWDRLDGAAIRRALDRDRYVYARSSAHLREFRITGYRTHRGLQYGLELATGKWVVICAWQVR